MLAFPDEVKSGPAAQQGKPPGGVCSVQLSWLDEIPPLSEEVAATMRRFGYPPRTSSGLR